MYIVNCAQKAFVKMHYPKNRFPGKTLTASIFNIFGIGLFYHKNENIL